MYRIAMTAIALSLVAPPAAAQSRGAATSAPAAGATCAALMRAYDGASKDLATTLARSIGDNSAPRATLRAIEDSNSLATAAIALDLMRDNHCPLPKSAPNSALYFNQALACETDRLKGQQSPDSCKRESWTPAI